MTRHHDWRQRAADGIKRPYMDLLKRKDNLDPDTRDRLPPTFMNESPNVSLHVPLSELGKSTIIKIMGQTTLDIDRDSSFQERFVDSPDLLKILSHS